MNRTLEIALDYLQRGLSVIPIQPRGKAPIIPTWRPFIENHATTAQVAAWLFGCPNANLAILTGETSGVIALDVDGPLGIRYVLDRGDFPLTPMTTTGRGRHIWFKHPGFIVRNFVARLPELDMRGDGGYVCAPPSIHPTGREYRWQVSLEVPFAPVPGWLMEIIKPAPKTEKPGPGSGAKWEVRQKTAYGRMALFSEAREVARNTVDRNNRLYRAALKMGSLIADGKVDRPAVESMLLEAASDCGLVADDGETQTIRTIVSGINKGMESPRGNYSKTKA